MQNILKVSILVMAVILAGCGDYYPFHRGSHVYHIQTKKTGIVISPGEQRSDVSWDKDAQYEYNVPNILLKDYVPAEKPLLVE